MPKKVTHYKKIAAESHENRKFVGNLVKNS